MTNRQPRATDGDRALSVAVIGHVEWVTFMPVDRSPSPGAILRASTSWEEPAGGGSVAAAELARLAGSCTFYTALGNDEVADRSREILDGLGVAVHAARRDSPQRRAITLVDPDGERSIVVVGAAQEPRLDDGLPLEALDGADAVYFCKGDAAMLREARRAKVLVATARVLPVIREAGVQLDALVRSAADPNERYAHGDLDHAPLAVVSTEGAAGGHYRLADGTEGRWTAVPVEDPQGDTYGAGDSFAAGLTYALGRGLTWPEALALAAERGALALQRVGAHGRLGGADQ